MKVESYKLQTAGGKCIRTATKVVLPNGQEIKFMERMSKSEAIKNAKYQLNLN